MKINQKISIIIIHVSWIIKFYHMVTILLIFRYCQGSTFYLTTGDNFGYHIKEIHQITENIFCWLGRKILAYISHDDNKCGPISRRYRVFFSNSLFSPIVCRRSMTNQRKISQEFFNLPCCCDIL